MNVVLLSGRLTADPEIRYRQDTGEQVANYTLAVDRGKDKADFVRCVAFEKRAEFAKNYLKKGTKILVEGRIRTGSYTNREGQKVYTTEVWVTAQEFAGSRQDAEAATAPPPASSPGDAQDAVADGCVPGFMAIPDGVDDDGLPFR